MGSSIVAAVAQQASCELSGEAVVLHFPSGLYFGLNSVGARIWALLGEPVRVDDLCARLLEEYEVDPDRCRRDLLAILHELIDARLIEVRGVADP